MNPTTLILIVAVVVLVALAAVFLLRRRRREPRVQVLELAGADANRYVEHMSAVEREFLDNPQQSAARARGLVEEVLRRMGFPDRIDGRQRARDLARHDGQAAKALLAADTGLRQHSGDTEQLRQVVQQYRVVLYRLLHVEADRAA